MANIKKYRKKPIEIEAIQFSLDNWQECFDFILNNGGEIVESIPIDEYTYISIKTLEGNMKASLGDYIIKGVNGEFYPCKSDIFEKTYEEV